MAPSGLRPVGVQAEGSFWPEARTPQEDVGLERSLKRGRVWSGGVKSGTVVSWEEAEELVRGDSAFPHQGVCRLHLGQPRSCPPGQASAKVSAMGRRADTGTGGIPAPPGPGPPPCCPQTPAGEASHATPADSGTPQRVHPIPVTGRWPLSTKTNSHYFQPWEKAFLTKKHKLSEIPDPQWWPTTAWCNDKAVPCRPGWGAAGAAACWDGIGPVSCSQSP